MILFVFCCLTAKTIVPKEVLPITDVEALTTYQSGQTEIELYDGDMNYIGAVSAEWDEGDIIITDPVLKRFFGGYPDPITGYNPCTGGWIYALDTYVM